MASDIKTETPIKNPASSPPSNPAASPLSTQSPAISSLGTVISTMESPNTSEFHFVIQSGDVHKGQFVQVVMPAGPILGSVTEISRANRYFERAESVAEYERLGVLSTQFPTTEWEYMVAVVRVQGVLNGAHMGRCTIPVAPGASVKAATEEQLKAFLQFDDNGLDIGTVAYHTLRVKLGLGRLLQKHLAILAMSGAGKSYFASVLIEELLDRKATDGRLAVVALDQHGEYVGFKDSVYRDKVTVVPGKKIRIGLRHLSASMLAEWSEMSSTARRALDKHVSSLKAEIKEKQEPVGLEELIERVRNDAELNKKENVRGPLLAALEELEHLRLIGLADTLKLSELIKPGHLIVLDLSDIDDLRKKQMIVSYYGRKLFRQRKKNLIPPYVMLVEEAHNFAREKAERRNALSKSMIEMIAREGRKFGASLCLITQRPVQLSTTALSQCNSNIILRVTNPFDLKHIGESCEGIDSHMLESITTLRVGEALVVGEASGAPIFVKIRQRRSKVVTRGESLEKLAKEFEDKSKVKEDEIEAFL